ncbi:hypothetical protein [Pseudalgibacter alginicilyticus]|uniref:hypothetical protein n=1 Tax=Pseudalgibacter alginicilyticus TaxID=1736674 RepID=UPI0026B11871
MKTHILLLITSFLFLSSCKNNTSNQNAQSEIDKLNTFFQKTYDEDVAESPMQQTRLGLKTENYGKWDDISDKKRKKKISCY